MIEEKRQFQSKTFPAVAYDGPSLDAFIGSVATAHAISANSSFRVDTLDKGSLGSILYACVHGRFPEAARYQFGTHAEFEELRQKLYGRYWNEWVDRATMGPAQAQEYVDRLVQVRAKSDANVQWMIKEASTINSDTIKRLCQTGRTLSTIKFGATTLLAVIPAGRVVMGLGCGLRLTLVGLAYGCTLSGIKNWGDGTNAQVLGVAKQVAGEGASAAGETWGSMVVKRTAHEISQQSPVYKNAMTRIESASRLLRNQMLSPEGQRKAARIVLRAAQEAQNAQSALTAAGAQKALGHLVGKGVPVAWAGWSVWGAFKEWQEELEQFKE